VSIDWLVLSHHYLLFLLKLLMNNEKETAGAGIMQLKESLFYICIFNIFLFYLFSWKDEFMRMRRQEKSILDFYLSSF